MNKKCTFGIIAFIFLTVLLCIGFLRPKSSRNRPTSKPKITTENYKILLLAIGELFDVDEISNAGIKEMIKKYETVNLSKDYKRGGISRYCKKLDKILACVICSEVKIINIKIVEGVVAYECEQSYEEIPEIIKKFAIIGKNASNKGSKIFLPMIIDKFLDFETTLQNLLGLKLIEDFELSLGKLFMPENLVVFLKKRLNKLSECFEPETYKKIIVYGQGYTCCSSFISDNKNVAFITKSNIKSTRNIIKDDYKIDNNWNLSILFFKKITKKKNKNRVKFLRIIYIF